MPLTDSLTHWLTHSLTDRSSITDWLWDCCQWLCYWCWNLGSPLGSALGIEWLNETWHGHLKWTASSGSTPGIDYRHWVHWHLAIIGKLSERVCFSKEQIHLRGLMRDSLAPKRIWLANNCEWGPRYAPPHPISNLRRSLEPVADPSSPVEPGSQAQLFLIDYAAMISYWNDFQESCSNTESQSHKEAVHSLHKPWLHYICEYIQ